MKKHSTVSQLSAFLIICFCLLQGLTDFKVDAKHEIKYYKYNRVGNLLINAAVPVPPESPPILLDAKKYYPTCTTNVYFTFTFTISPSINNLDSCCDQGMTICYEGQLVGDHVRMEYLIKNVKTTDAEKWTKVCMAANKNRTTDGIRALNVAVKTLQNLDSKDITSEDNEFKANNAFGNYSNNWHFFVIGSTFIKHKYYFIVPEDGIMILHIGERKSMEVKITDSAGHPIPMVKFTYDGKAFGVIESFKFPKKLNRANGGILRDYVGFWMFYLDFKSDYRVWQAISTVHPIIDDQTENSGKQPCPMLLEIRGNRMRPCRTYFEDIAIFDKVDAHVNITYTSMVGTVKTQQHGEEDTRATINRWKKAQMEVRSTKDMSQYADSQSTINQKEMLEIHFKMEEKRPCKLLQANMKLARMQMQNKLLDQASDAADMGKADGVNAKLTAYVNWQRTDFKSHREQNVKMKSNIDTDTKRMFSDITRSQSMMNKFKNTVGTAEEMRSTEFLQTNKAFTTWESVDVSVQLPPNTKLYIRQLMFDCDGNLIKMPFTYYSDGKSKLNLNDNNSGSKRSKRNIGWSNVTLGEAAAEF